MYPVPSLAGIPKVKAYGNSMINLFSKSTKEKIIEQNKMTFFSYTCSSWLRSSSSWEAISPTRRSALDAASRASSRPRCSSSTHCCSSCKSISAKENKIRATKSIFLHDEPLSRLNYSEHIIILAKSKLRLQFAFLFNLHSFKQQAKERNDDFAIYHNIPWSKQGKFTI